MTLITNFPNGIAVPTGGLTINGVAVEGVIADVTASAAEINKTDGIAVDDALVATPADSSRIAMGVGTVTGATLAVATGLTAVAGAVVSINEDPGAGAGDVYTATVTFTGADLTISIWQDGSEVATEDTSVSWIAWGT